MATIDDIGDVDDPLNAPVLGGPNGWAAAVRDYLKDLLATIAGKVSKAGDTMTGPLILDDANTDLINIAGSRYSDLDVVRIGEGPVSTAGGLARIMVNHPTGDYHAATKGYVDARAIVQHGTVAATVNGQGVAVTFPVPFTEIPDVVASPIKYVGLTAVVNDFGLNGCTVAIWDAGGGGVPGDARIAWIAAGR